MKPDALDDRPRIFIEAHRDGVTASWKRHPAGKGEFARSAGAALDAALTELGCQQAVIIWEGRP